MIFRGNGAPGPGPDGRTPRRAPSRESIRLRRRNDNGQHPPPGSPSSGFSYDTCCRGSARSARYRSSRYLRTRRSRVTDTDTPRRPPRDTRSRAVIESIRLVLHGDKILSSIPRTLSRRQFYTNENLRGREIVAGVCARVRILVFVESGARPAARKYCVAISVSRICSRSRVSRIWGDIP